MLLSVTGDAEKFSVVRIDAKIGIVIDTNLVMNVPPFLSATSNTEIRCASANLDEEVLILRSLVEKMPKLAPLLEKLFARSEARLQPLHSLDDLRNFRLRVHGFVESSRAVTLQGTGLRW